MDVWESVEVVGGTVPERLSETIAQLIDAGTLPAGSRLPGERGLAERLGASRISVRQALQDLEQRGYLHSRPRSGWIVSAPGTRVTRGDVLGAPRRDARTIREVMDLRLVIEPPIAARAAVRHFAHELADVERPLLESELELGSSGPRVDVFRRCDVTFHTGIARIAHNPLLTRLVDETQEWTSPTRQTAFQTDVRTRQSVIAHRVIFAALRARDGAGAHRAMMLHLREVLETIEPLTDSDRREADVDAATPPDAQDLVS